MDLSFSAAKVDVFSESTKKNLQKLSKIDMFSKITYELSFFAHDTILFRIEWTISKL